MEISGLSTIGLAKLRNGPFRHVLPSLIFVGLAQGCARDDGPPLGDVFFPATEQYLDELRADWTSRDLSAQSVEVVHEESVEDYDVMIVRHEVADNAHFGAIVVPHGGTAGRPVVVIADGLNQADPSLNLEGLISNHSGDYPTGSLIKVIPAFRGRTLLYRDLSLHSDGDFCDAYDGAADDAIAMLNVAEALYPEANFASVLAEGASRGGNTALLMGARDSRINTIIAMAAPVDFFWQPLVEEYGEQYACQFLAGKSANQARARMLQSSPVYFDMTESVTDAFLFHGSRDEIVPLWNSLDMAARLEANGVNVTTFFYRNSTHRSFPRRAEYPAAYASAVDQFLRNVAYR